jgi:hypothetical protein
LQHRRITRKWTEKGLHSCWLSVTWSTKNIPQTISPGTSKGPFRVKKRAKKQRIAVEHSSSSWLCDWRETSITTYRRNWRSVSTQKRSSFLPMMTSGTFPTRATGRHSA